jgi:undecaprenyl-phosphate 4-deoxy-4-formamido-L-arabinose transferase
VNPSFPDSISVVVPVYNNAGGLALLVERLEGALPALTSRFEVILVDDGSRDASWEAIKRLSAGRPWLRGIHMMRNYGQHNATLCGLRAARHAVIVTMDDDLQHPPEEIHKLLSRLQEGYDVVYGVPDKLPHTGWRNWFSIFTKWVLANVMGIGTIREIGAFRALRADLRKAFEAYRSPDVLVDVLLSWGTTRFGSAVVNEQPRQAGRSHYNFFKLARVAMVILTGFSTAPLRFASMLGFIFTLFGVGVFVYVLGVYFLAGSIPGFPFLASIIALFSGTQLFALGLIGEYLARIFERSMERPPYVIGETIQAE